MRLREHLLYPLCWGAHVIWRLLPLSCPVGMALLPYAGMYAYSETFEDFCRCKPFQKRHS